MFRHPRHILFRPLPAIRTSSRIPRRPIITISHPRRPLPYPPPPPPPSPSPPRIHPSITPSRPYRIGPGPHHDHALRTARPLPAPRTPHTLSIIVIAVVGGTAYWFTNLETVPVSGRTRFNIYNNSSLSHLSDATYRKLLYDFEQRGVEILPSHDWRVQWVTRVMNRLIPFSGMSSSSSSSGEEETKTKWQLYVVDDPDIPNAFVLPNGKVFVFTGILPVAHNDDGLATILGHEIAHNVAAHSAERLSADFGTGVMLFCLMVGGGLLGLGPLLTHVLGGWAMNVAFELPMSRMQESEADYIGLMMMAQACFDPREASRVWERMDRLMVLAGREGKEVDWLSTHPTNEERVEKMRGWLGEALRRREESDCRTTVAFADLFRRAMQRGVVLV